MITDREKKISLLKDIQSGKKLVKDLQPAIYETWKEVESWKPGYRGGNPRMFRGTGTEEILTEAELTERSKGDKRNATYIKVVYDRTPAKPYSIHSNE